MQVITYKNHRFCIVDIWFLEEPVTIAADIIRRRCADAKLTKGTFGGQLVDYYNCVYANTTIGEIRLNMKKTFQGRVLTEVDEPLCSFSAGWRNEV